LVGATALEIGIEQTAITDAKAYRQLIPPLRIEKDLGANASKPSVVWLPFVKEVRGTRMKLFMRKRSFRSCNCAMN
jgi:hypothetical protein